MCASEENGTAGQADLGGIGAVEGEEGTVEVAGEEIVEVEVAEATVEGVGVVATVAEVDVNVVKVMLTCNKDKKHTD